MDYKTMYFTLFEAITKSIGILQKAQQDTENMYIEQKDTPVIQLVKKDDEE